jgi:hypothetical protein
MERLGACWLAGRDGWRWAVGAAGASLEWWSASAEPAGAGAEALAWAAAQPEPQRSALAALLGG